MITANCYKTGGNLFGRMLPAMDRLERDLSAALARYRAALPPAAGVATHWPASSRLRGWFVRLQAGGHQNCHNHAEG